MNRGIAKRRVFESERDIRYFLSRVAREVRKGSLEVHAYCILSTHFHLLVRSPGGELSEAMQRVESRYVKWFNGQRDRDGALFRGRFLSKLVENDIYQEVLIRYIDQNPVAAGVVSVPGRYPFCTAFHWSRDRFPPWLEDGWVRGELLRRTGDGSLGHVGYHDVFAASLSPEHSDWVLQRARRLDDGADPISMLFDGAPKRVREWLDERATLSDGYRRPTPVVGPNSADDTLGRMATDIGAVEGCSRIRVTSFVRAAVLRDICGLSYREVAARMLVSSKTARNRYDRHRELMAKSPVYSRFVTSVVVAAVRRFVAAR